jgi:hypothetical protein
MREMASISLGELMEFTGWERSQWRERLSTHGDAALGVGVGAHGDGRFETVGDLVKHIFIAEKHHVDRLSNRPIADVSTIPGDSLQNLFAFGERSRRDLVASWLPSQPSAGTPRGNITSTAKWSASPRGNSSPISCSTKFATGRR